MYIAPIPLLRSPWKCARSAAVYHIPWYWCWTPSGNLFTFLLGEVRDDECSKELKEVILDTCKLQLLLPGCHQANLAEVAIKAFKRHFCSILAGIAIDFPHSFWNERLPQTLLTLNLLQKLNATPTVLGHTHLCGQHDYNAQPLLPIGQSAEVHVKCANQKSWDYHSKPACYLYTSEEHYRTHMFLMKETKAKRLSDTAAMLLRRITDPTLTVGDPVIQSMARLASDIGMFAGKKNNDANMNDLRQLAEIGKRLAAQSGNSAASPDEATVLPDTSPPAHYEARPGVRYSPRIAESIRVERAKIEAQSSARIAESIRVERAKLALLRVINALEPTMQPPIVTHNAQPRVSFAIKPTTVSHDAQPRVPITRAKPPTPQQIVPIASRTRANKAKIEELNNPIARRTQSPHALETALAAHAEFDGKSVSAQRLASRRFPKAVFETALAVMDIESGKMMKHRQLINHTQKLIRERWTHSSANEFGRLFQGVGNRIKSPTNTCYFIHKHDVPLDRFKDVTYGKFECSVRTQKVDEPYRTRLVLGRNKIYCDFDIGTQTVDMLLVKILLNSVI